MLLFRRWHYGSIFIRLDVVASQNREIRRNSDKIWLPRSWRSSKVIDLGVNGKPICDFLLVINCNYSRLCYRFWHIHDVFKIDNFTVYEGLTTSRRNNHEYTLRRDAMNEHARRTMTNAILYTDSKAYINIATNFSASPLSIVWLRFVNNKRICYVAT